VRSVAFTLDRWSVPRSVGGDIDWLNRINVWPKLVRVIVTHTHTHTHTHRHTHTHIHTHTHTHTRTHTHTHEHTHTQHTHNTRIRYLTQGGPWDFGLLMQEGSSGGTAIKVDGNWSHAGLDLGKNDLRLGKGARIVFEGAEKNSVRAVAPSLVRLALFTGG
jgi:hypothetical protein